VKFYAHLQPFQNFIEICINTDRLTDSEAINGFQLLNRGACKCFGLGEPPSGSKGRGSRQAGFDSDEINDKRMTIYEL